ncbi:MAG: hypothetical protein ABSG75_16400 [Syntrophales bacterium]|jgi:hypothetical protein
MILFIAPSFDMNLFFCLYDNETVSRCSKSLPAPWPVTNQESLPAMITASHRDLFILTLKFTKSAIGGILVFNFEIPDVMKEGCESSGEKPYNAI